jgi:hypothetical protein
MHTHIFHPKSSQRVFDTKYALLITEIQIPVRRCTHMQRLTRLQAHAPEPPRPGHPAPVAGGLRKQRRVQIKGLPAGRHRARDGAPGLARSRRRTGSSESSSARCRGRRRGRGTAPGAPASSEGRSRGRRGARSASSSSSPSSS